MIILITQNIHIKISKYSQKQSFFFKRLKTLFDYTCKLKKLEYFYGRKSKKYLSIYKKI
jgi:hypothetical protein